MEIIPNTHGKVVATLVHQSVCLAPVLKGARFGFSGRCCGESGLSLGVRDDYASTYDYYARVTGTPCVQASCPIRICKTIGGHHPGGLTFGIQSHYCSQVGFVQQLAS